MVITERYYPYPVLGGKAVAFNGDCVFAASFRAFSNSKKVVIEIAPELKEPNLEHLLTTGEARLLCHIECPATTYREVKDVPATANTNAPFKVELLSGLIAKRVEVNLVIVANSHLSQYGGDSLVGIYHGRTFDVEQGALLAVTQTFSFDVQVKDSRITDAKSPVQICPDPDETVKIMSVKMECQEITVFLPQDQFKVYKSMDDGKSISSSGNRNHDLLISLVVVPALVEVLARIALCDELPEGRRNVEQYSGYDWYAPINQMVADYLNGEGVMGDLSTIDFDNHPFLKVAQALASNPMSNAFTRLEEV